MTESISSGRWWTSTSNQSRYVLAELARVGTYMIPMGHAVEGVFRPEDYLQAATMMINRHDALRTCFKIEGGLVRASVSSDPCFQYHLIVPADDSLDSFRKLALPLIFDDVNPLESGSLVRIIVADYGGRWRFTIAAHHAITDGFSRGVMNKELLKLYAGEELPTARSYYEFAQAQPAPDTISSAARSDIDDLPKPMRLIGDSIGKGAPTDQGQFIDFAMGDIGSSVRKLSKSIGTTKFGLFAAIYALGAYGFSGSTAVTSFFQTEGRRALGAPNSVVGPFSNTLPLDLDVDLDRDLASFARDASGYAKQVMELESAPGFLDAVLNDGKAPSISINLFPPSSPVRAGDLVVGDREFLDRRTEFDLNLVWAEDRNILKARAFYDRSHMSRARVLQFLEHQERLLRVALESPHRPCRDILAAARQAHTAALPQTSLEPEPGRRLHQAFFAKAAQTPEAIAIRTSTTDISYAQLEQDVRRIVASLQAAGVRQTDAIAIYAQRDPALVAAMLGVSATGASFALVDASYPISRCQQMIEDVGARFLIETGKPAPHALQHVVKTVNLNASPQMASIVDGAPRRAACHMFTSGTSGRPKLITHPDTTLQRFLSWQASTLALEAPINTMLMSGLAHDPALRDVFLPLSHGGTVTIPSPCQLLDPKALRALLDTSGCNVVRLSTSTAQLLTMGAEEGQTLTSIRGIFWGGERLPHKTPRKWQSFAPNARQFHVFGTTETPQAFLVHEIDEASFDGRDIPLGMPLPWTGVRLVDDEGSTVSVGEVGEIVAELADPVGGIDQKYELKDAASACQHFTGDLGYQRADGSVCFIGRRDGQIKINGFRVELKEIEFAIEQSNGGVQAKALYRDGRLFVFVQGDPENITPAGIKSEIAQRLPTYMVPDQAVVVPAFPITSNGKVDEAALIASARQESELPANSALMTAPEGQDEKTIAAIFSKATGGAKIHRDATLTDLGADSLSTIETRLALEEKGFELPKQWEWLPVHSLALHRRTSRKEGRQFAGFQVQNVDTFLILRSVAIVLIVVQHTGQVLNVGASLILMTIAGFSFGRVHLPAILKDGRTGRIWALIAKLLVPLIPASLIIYAAHIYFGNDPHIATILFYENIARFIETFVLQKTGVQHHIVWLWFLHVYLQIFVLLGLLLGLPRVRKAAAKDPWRLALTAFGCSALIGFGAIQLASLTVGGGDFALMARMLQYSPTTILPFFLIGLMFSLAETSNRLVISIGIALAFFLVSQTMPNHGEWGWLLAMLLCTLMPYTPLPKIAKPIVMQLSVHALMIYLSHRTVYFLLGESGLIALPLAVLVAIQLIFGVLLGVALRPLIERLGINRLSNRRISF